MAAGAGIWCAIDLYAANLERLRFLTNFLSRELVYSQAGGFCVQVEFGPIMYRGRINWAGERLSKVPSPAIHLFIGSIEILSIKFKP